MLAQLFAGGGDQPIVGVTGTGDFSYGRSFRLCG
jgi:hypothetical protein